MALQARFGAPRRGTRMPRRVSSRRERRRRLPRRFGAFLPSESAEGDADAGRSARAKRVAAVGQPPPARLAEAASHPRGLGGEIWRGLFIPNGDASGGRDRQSGLVRPGSASEARYLPARRRHGQGDSRDGVRRRIFRRGRSVASATETFGRGSRPAEFCEAYTQKSRPSPTGSWRA